MLKMLNEVVYFKKKCYNLQMKDIFDSSYQNIDGLDALTT